MVNLNHFFDSIIEGKIILFVGAGLSASKVRKNGNGLPTWKQLVQAMIQKLKSYSSEPSNQHLDQLFHEENYLEIAKIFKEKVAPMAFSKFLQEHLDPDDLNEKGSDLHRLILNAGFAGVVTTNFDRVFENSDRKIKPLTYPDAFDQPANFWASNFFAKIHGCISNKNPTKNLILTSEDYSNVIKDPKYITILNILFGGNTILTVGYSLSDPDFISILEYYNRIFHNNAPRPFVLLKRGEILDRKETLNSIPIQLIEYDSHDEIPAIIEQIKNHLRDSRPKVFDATLNGKIYSDLETEQNINASKLNDFEIPIDSVFETVINLWEKETKKNIDNLSKSINSLGSSFESEVEKDKAQKEIANFLAIELETLYYFISTKIKNRSVYSPFNKLAQMRATAFAHALLVKDRISDQNCRWIVNTITTNMPEDGFSEYLKEISIDSPCNERTKFYWATIINTMLSPGNYSNDIAFDSSAIEKLVIDGYYPETDHGKIAIFSQLDSSETIQRIHAAFQVLEWGFRLLCEPSEKIPEINIILDKLIRMLQSEINADRIASAAALRWIVRTGRDIPDGNRIRDADRDALIKELLSGRNTSLSLNNLILTISFVFQSHVSDKESLNWFRQKNDKESSIDIQIKRCEPPAELIEFVVKVFKKNEFNTLWNQRIAVAILRMDVWIDEMNAAIAGFIFDLNNIAKEKIEVIHRLTKLPEKKGAGILKAIVSCDSKDFDNQYRCLSLGGLLEIGVANELKNTDIEYACKLANLDANILLDMKIN